MIGGQEQWLAIAIGAIDQLAAAVLAAAAIGERIASDRTNLLTPGVALWADGIDIAGAGLDSIGALDAAIALADTIEFEVDECALRRRHDQFDDGFGPWDQRQRESANARIIGVGVRAADHTAPGIAEPQLRALRQMPLRKTDIEADRAFRLYRHAPQQTAIAERSPFTAAVYRNRLDGMRDRITERQFGASGTGIFAREFVQVESVEMQRGRHRRGIQRQQLCWRLRGSRAAGDQGQSQKVMGKSHGILQCHDGETTE